MPTLKDLQEQLNNLKSKFSVWLIVLIAAVALAVILLITVFRPKGKVDESYKLEIERLQEKVELLEQSNALRDSIIAGHDQRLQENRKTETIIKHHYDKIPSTVTNLDREQLRREVANY